MKLKAGMYCSVLTEERRRRVAVVLSIWVIVPIVAAVYLATQDLTENAKSAVIIALFISAFFETVGVVFSLNHHSLMAGISTMSGEEKKYDLDGITSFAGLSLSVISATVFFVSMICIARIGVLAARS
ncbi:MAG: hypothetical protein LBJ20_05245 [Candidatus Methanoplasma sp.]|jgi:hypothetical protein|nr:hypothetical protein [Candidatus Methanoplasma sp.]